MAHWKAELAAAEAAAWLKENAGWAKGLPAEVEGVKLKGTGAEPRNVPGWDELPWWRMDGAKVGAPAPRIEQSPARKTKKPSRGYRGPLAGEPMPLPQAKPVEAEPTAAEQREAARALRMPQRKLAPCTWVLGDANGMKELLWAERQKQVKQNRSGEKGARVLEAALGWKTSNAEVYAAQRELRGEMVLRQVSEEEMPCKPSPLEEMALQEELAWRLKALSPREREVLELKAEGLSGKRQAEALGCSPKRAEKVLAEARAKARQPKA